MTASVATTLAAFVPLMLWPGVSGGFIRYLPFTVFAVLSGSLLYALVFGPVLGALVARSGKLGGGVATISGQPAPGAPVPPGRLTAWYARLLKVATRHSWATAVIVVLGVMGVFAAYGLFGRGMIFFTEEGDQWGQIRVRAQGNFSADEVDLLVREVEERLMRVRGVRNVNTVTSTPGNVGEDLIGDIDIEMHGREVARRDAASILEEIRRRTQSLAGIEVEVRGRNFGPVSGQPLELELASHDKALIDPAMARIREYMATRVDGLRNVSDTGSLPGIEWNLIVDRAQAALYGADVMHVGIAAQLLTNGIKIGEYRPRALGRRGGYTGALSGRVATPGDAGRTAHQHRQWIGAAVELRALGSCAERGFHREVERNTGEVHTCGHGARRVGRLTRCAKLVPGWIRRCSTPR